ncbi:MAG: hypothetical protein UV80_C0006G0039 [Candidatus Peregrinibacteria bacterium GW2011_GWF2_43_17]|nr:MAG: hypothetical protein UV80_C0006G0039 [Candidatus Peregrinibacteria bacterium GW2011_GWF2_43_17]KKT19563.1 MAG: hypothetical protein UW03_C0016G0020 [Candidatus Peregrinibacteria bacterium GW2011_GWA2_43_8]
MSKNGTTNIPNDLIDFFFPILNGAEAKIALYICRRTYGFHRRSDRISYKQFRRGITKKDGEVLDMGTELSCGTLNKVLRLFESIEFIKIARYPKQTTEYVINEDFKPWLLSIKFIKASRDACKSVMQIEKEQRQNASPDQYIRRRQSLLKNREGCSNNKTTAVLENRETIVRENLVNNT